MGKWMEFARTEIYAFHRLTAILTTFFMAAGFTVLAVRGGLECSLVLGSFIGLVIIGSANIFLVWWRLKRVIFKYYAKLDQKGFKETPLCKRIEKHSGKWERAIWWTFLGCFAVFFGFLVVVLSS